MTSKTYGYGVEAADTFGLNPAEFFVHIGVNRRDGKALTPAQLAAVEAALAPLATKAAPPAGDTAKVARIASENEAAHKAMVAKVTGKKAPAKGPKKAATKASRKTAAKPARKAARRPSRG